MSNIKCPQCGLINWIDAESCKRCKAPLSQTKETPDAQAPVAANESAPPDLTVCAVCGGADGLTSANITRKYTPNWVWLFLPFGILPAGILGMVLQVKHSFSLPVCRKCMQRRSWIGLISWGSIVACIFIFFLAVAVGAAAKSWIAFLVVMAIAVAVALFAGWFDKKANPRYVEFTKALVEIDVPGKGKIRILDKRGFEGA